MRGSARSLLTTTSAQPIPRSLADCAADAEAAGQTAMLVGWAGKVRGVLIVADTVKPTCAGLSDMG